MGETIRIDFWFDLVCPWCYIGTRRLAAGVAQFQRRHPRATVIIEEHSYELAPQLTDDFVSGEADFMVAYEGVPRNRAERMLVELTSIGEREGVTLNFDRVQHVSSRRGHAMLQLAKRHGVAPVLHEKLCAAYFSDGQRLTDTALLLRLADEVGLPQAEAVAVLSDDPLADEMFEEVDLDTQRARMMGVTGVPFALFNHSYSVTGAQTAEACADAIEQVLQLSRSERAEE